MLRLRHIEIFHAVYRCGSISAAARDLNVSQPSVSKVLRHAEDQLGYDLFERGKAGMKPTAAAHELFSKAKDVYGDVRALNQLAKNIRERRGGHIRLGVLPSLGLSVVPEAIALSRARNPEISFEINTLHSNEIAEALFQQGCDIAIGYGEQDNPRLLTQELGRSELMLVARHDQFGPDGGPVMLADLDGLEIVSLRDSGPCGDLFSDQLSRAGVSLREVVTARTHYVAMSLVSYGVGIAVVDSFTAAFNENPSLSMHRFADPIRYSVNAITADTVDPGTGERTAQSELVNGFLDVLREVISRSHSAHR